MNSALICYTATRSLATNCVSPVLKKTMCDVDEVSAYRPIVQPIVEKCSLPSVKCVLSNNHSSKGSKSMLSPSWIRFEIKDP